MAAWARPLSAAYGAAAAWRRRASRRPGYQRRLRRPVVSVGNLVVGGAGKTPIVAHLAGLLRDAGEYPAILSRGYRRSASADGVVVVRDARAVRADLSRSGDEPLMLAEGLPGCAVVVGTDRYLAGVLAESRLGCTVHVLDDGFQHLALARDVDLLVVATGDLATEAVLPQGTLREPPAAAAVADGWLGEPDELHLLEPLAREAGVRHLFGVARALGNPVPLVAGGAVPAPDASVLLVSGVAKPARFEADVRQAGWRVVEHVAFADHHAYAAADVERCAERAAAVGAQAILTTAKDAVKLRALPRPRIPVAVVPLSATLEPFDAFRRWLLARLAHAARARTGVTP